MASNPYRDSIGNRLDHPDLVPPEYQHLIADDQQRVKRILEIPVSGLVLDVGCSDGAVTRRISKCWQLHPWGCDVDLGDGPVFDGCYVTWDIRVPWEWFHPLTTFDAVYCCEVLEHLTDTEVHKALANLCAVLKPAGDLIVTVPNRDCAEHYVAGCRDRWKWPDHRSVWTADKLWKLLGHFGVGDLRPIPLYDGEGYWDSIWLIAHAKGRR